MSEYADTIAGLATAPGRSGAGVVRVSGPSAMKLLETCFTADEESRRKDGFFFADGQVRCSDETSSVPCRVFVMKAPRSYTREDVTEFHLPGSPELLDLFLRYCYSQGIRMPEPGEFTKRAFLNGRIDLIEAAGVMEVIRASDSTQLSAARSICFGNVSEKLKHIENMIRDLLALVELSIDFADQDEHILSRDEYTDRIVTIMKKIRELREQDRIGNEAAGVSCFVIAGMVNAGKSTLFNRLAGRDRCRVSAVPGTTRDMVSETVYIQEIPFMLYDSAGLSVEPGIFEKHARRIFRNRGRDIAGMLLLVSPEMEIPDALREYFLECPGPGSTIAVGTKSDLGIPNRSIENGLFSDCYSVITLNEHDDCSIGQLKNCMAEMVRSRKAGQSVSSTGMMDSLLASCAERLERLKQTPAFFDEPECAAEELRDARNHLDRFGSDDPDADILNRIFSSFCIGK